MRSPINVVLRKSQVTGILERICQQLELTDTQYQTATARYEAVGTWLADSNESALQEASIYPQGSISLQTTVKPLSQDEYDVDLVCHVPYLSANTPPSALKALIGNRLKANERYKNILEEKPRCWRINYANEFHLDITPSIPNILCSNRGELVPDKRRNAWKASNPKGYQRQFDDRAKLRPRLLLRDAAFAEARAQVEALPEPTQFKGLLRRSIQLCKRHRDHWFSNQYSDLAPISVIITTLASKSYEHCVTNNVYDTEIDVFLDVVRHMPDFVEKVLTGGQEWYFVWNESTQGENFAEKWNENRRLADAFFHWQIRALADFEQLAGLSGLDKVRDELSVTFGEHVVAKAMAIAVDNVGTARKTGGLILASATGLSATKAHGVTVPPNTFFGT